MKRTLACLIVFVFCLGMMPCLVGSAPLPAARPESMGFSPERLARLHALIQGHIDQGRHAGAISAIARRGHLVDVQTYGYRDREAHKLVERNTIFRIYSMSKVITSVAVLQLFEEGHFALNDPVSQFIPELKDLKVCRGGTVEAPVLEEAASPITIKHLLTHTAGFAYGFSAKDPVKTLYERANILESDSLKEFIQRLAKLPLVRQPGEGFFYGVNTDVLGYLVEAVSGQPFEDYLQEHIFDPLDMPDTGFDVPPEKMPRLAKLYESGPDGTLRAVAQAPYGTHPEMGRGFASGGGGLFSTADDYLRFAQMLLNGGALEGRQILGRKTVELMMANNLTFLEKGTLGDNGWEGFGLGGSVRLDVPKSSTLGSVGEFGWNGAATTTFRIDPNEQTVALLFAQHLPYNEHGIFDKFYRLFYAALVD